MSQYRRCRHERNSTWCGCAALGTISSEAAREHKPSRASGEIMARLQPLDTYEQSALARRRVAIREFEAMRMQEQRRKKLPP
jgi:hypothetical protein